MKEIYNRLFGESWAEVLSKNLDEKIFEEIGAFVKSERDKTIVYPSQENIFRAFRMTPYDKVKVVLLGMDPYPNENQATGLSFAVPQGNTLPPSLRLIRQELERSYDTLLLDFDTTFEKWADQGVLMLNSALTVRAKESGSHMRQWEPFTASVISCINRKPNVRWILLGNNAQSFAPMIDVDHFIFKAPHPMAEVYRPGCGFIGSNIFLNVNASLEALDEKPIEWLI